MELKKNPGLGTQALAKVIEDALLEMKDLHEYDGPNEGEGGTIGFHVDIDSEDCCYREYVVTIRPAN